MCETFSCIAVRNKKVYWKLGMDSHNDLIKEFNLNDDKIGKLIPIEVIPTDYLNMTIPSQTNKHWNFKFDEECPDWWTDSHERACWSACKEWYSKSIKLVNWKEARNPIHPFKIKMVKKVTTKQKMLLKEWASVRASVRVSVWASVRASVGDSVGDSVRDSVWASVWASVGASVRDSVRASVGDSVRASVGDSVGDSVWAYIGSLFYLKRNQWEYTEKIKTAGYPFQCAVDLLKQGLVPSFDGEIWRLHSGEKAEVVFEISKKDLKNIKTNQRGRK